MKPTPEQETILSHLPHGANLQINALAGTGKTGTLELIQAEVGGPILCLAFNKAVAGEMEKRFASTTTVRTFNSLGHRIWSKTCAGKVVLNPKKSQELLKEEIKKLGKAEQEEAWEGYWEVIQAVGLAKNLGYIPNGKIGNGLIDGDSFFAQLEERPNSLSRRLIDAILARSIATAYAGNIDYNDQIYMPALFGGTFPKFPLVLVDEAQDLSPSNHHMLQKMGSSRIISVGDPFQSIYQFRGACQDGMRKLQASFSMTELPLSISWRCPERIVENARWRAPEFKWNRAGGRVDNLRTLTREAVSDGSAIICRNNAPLFRLAFDFISSGRSVRVAGSDIGPKLVGIMRRFGDENLQRLSVLSAISAWEERKHLAGSTSARDMAECMRIFANASRDLGQAIAYAEDILRRDGSILLTTGHKAKGLEWDTVYHLDPWLIGSSEQEMNLRYVIQTRAKEAYYEINSKDIR